MNLYDILKKIDVKYKEIEHDPVYTIEEAQKLKDKIKGIGTKSLFLKDKKDNYYLVILEENKKANIKQIEKLASASHLSFAKEIDLQNILHLEKGSVTPFGIINDLDNRVLLILDNDLKGKQLLFHPNTNTKTISVMFNDLIKFIEFENHNYIFLD